MCVNEKGWGLIVGECRKGMSGKARIPRGSFKSLCDNKEFHTMHGCAIVMVIPPSMTAMKMKKGKEEKENGEKNTFNL